MINVTSVKLTISKGEANLLAAMLNVPLVSYSNYLGVPYLRFNMDGSLRMVVIATPTSAISTNSSIPVWKGSLADVLRVIPLMNQNSFLKPETVYELSNVTDFN
jgi:hypothetical protein